jgi:hypothetical protein
VNELPRLQPFSTDPPLPPSAMCTLLVQQFVLYWDHKVYYNYIIVSIIMIIEIVTKYISAIDTITNFIDSR